MCQDMCLFMRRCVCQDVFVSEEMCITRCVGF